MPQNNRPPNESYTEHSICNLPLSDLHPFPDHPFEVREDETMRETVESIKQHGVLMPIIVRPRDAGGYEIISGHRRKRACELAGIDSIPAIIREFDRDAATICMVDSNLMSGGGSPATSTMSMSTRSQESRHRKHRCRKIR